MRALLCTEIGGLETLTVGEVAPPPAPGAGEVLIDVQAAGVNFADLLMIKGQYQVKHQPPFTPGLEVAGIVRACGSGVTRVRAGDRVIAVMDGGGFAEMATARESDVFAVPPEMDLITAAGFAIAYGTAHGALRWRADIQEGEVLLVHGAGGGVGLTAVEVGKALGAVVIATAGSEEKLAVAKDHGADHLIDYRTQNIRDRVRGICPGVDVVFDPVGGSAFEQSLRCVNWGARLVIIGFAGGQVPSVPANILLVKNIAAIGFYWGSYRRHKPAMLQSQFKDLFQWWREGRLRPMVANRFDLSESAAALELLRDRKSTGKVVVDLRGSSRAATGE